MSGEQFEDLLAHLFEIEGWTVELTPRFGDFGGDLVLTRGSARTLVQAKRWNRQVGVKAVQEAAAARPHFHCDAAMVVTTDFFGREAKELAESNAVELWDRGRLLDALASAGLLATAENDYELECRKCGADMVLRNGRAGAFYGCSTFPACWHKLPVAAAHRIVLVDPAAMPALPVAPLFISAVLDGDPVPGNPAIRRRGIRGLIGRLVS